MKDTTFSWSMAIMHAFFYTLAVLGIDFCIIAVQHPTDTWSHMDFVWVIESFVGILVVLVVFSIQRTTEMFDRFIYLIIFTAFVIMLLATFEQGYEKVSVDYIKGVINDTTNPISSFIGGFMVDQMAKFQSAFSFIAVVGKALLLEAVTLFIGHFSGLIRVTIPERGALYSRHYKVSDDWRDRY